MVKLHGWPLYGSAFVSAWLFFGTVLKVLQAWQRDQKLERERGPERLHVGLYVLYEAMLVAHELSSRDENAAQKVRITIHKLEGEELVQLFDSSSLTALDLLNSCGNRLQADLLILEA